MSDDERKRDFWVIAALDYDKDEGWIVAKSDDVSKYDVIDGAAVSDSIDWPITPDMVPGLYKLTLNPWSRQSYEGEWDSGVDVDRAELLTEFPAKPN